MKAGSDAGPMAILAILAVAGDTSACRNALGGSNHFDKFLAPVFQRSALRRCPPGTSLGEPPSEAAAERSSGRNIELVMDGSFVGAALLGFFFAWLLYQRRRDLPIASRQD